MNTPPPPPDRNSNDRSKPSVVRRKTDDDDADIHVPVDPAGVFRGIAAATRKLLLPMKKAIQTPAMKSAIRTVGQNRPLAFASEGAVAGQAILPRAIYYGAWTLSGVAITADIYTRREDAPEDKKWQTAVYWSAFHVPASLVVPALIIHQVVHTVEEAMERPFAKSWTPRSRAAAPVVAALLSIGPVVPIVDTAAEMIMEPTLGAYLGLEFDHHHGDGKSKED